MFVPRQIASLGKLAAKESTRYAFNGVRFERRNGSARAMVTDGRRALIASWDEPDAKDYPAIDGFNLGARVDNFGTILPTVALDRASRGCIKQGRNPKPVLNNFVIDEPSANGTVKLAANRLDAIEHVTTNSIEGTFPPIDDVVPRVSEVHGAHVEGKKIEDGFEVVPMLVKVNPDNTNGNHAAVVAVNPALLKEMLDTMIKTGAKFVTISVPCSPGNRPIRLDARTEENVKLVGVLMPVNRNA